MHVAGWERPSLFAHMGKMKRNIICKMKTSRRPEACGMSWVGGCPQPWLLSQASAMRECVCAHNLPRSFTFHCLLQLFLDLGCLAHPGKKWATGTFQGEVVLSLGWIFIPQFRLFVFHINLKCQCFPRLHCIFLLQIQKQEHKRYRVRADLNFTLTPIGCVTLEKSLSLSASFLRQQD